MPAYTFAAWQQEKKTTDAAAMASPKK